MAIAQTMRPERQSTDFARPVRLSKREVEVLKLIAAGHSSGGAADVLCLSKRTVDFHLANVYTKLRVDNRMRAVRRAEVLRLIPLETDGL